MLRSLYKAPLRGGIYHISLLLITVSSFNLGFDKLTGINIVGRIFAGTQFSVQGIALALCVASVIVIWNNWVD